MTMTIFEKKALYAFGCPNREATVERLHMIAVLAPDCETKNLFFNLAVKLSADCAERWYPCFFRTLREEMAIYYEAELTMIRRVARRLLKGVNAPGWAERKLSETAQVHRQLSELLAALT